jgi:hypothetical protein
MKQIIILLFEMTSQKRNTKELFVTISKSCKMANARIDAQ